jgi:hypothetical protein
MSIRRVALESPLQQLGLYGVSLAAVFLYLGVSVETAVLSSVTWIALAASGGFIIQTLVGSAQSKLKMFIAFGPGALLGLGLSVFIFLLFRGGEAGVIAVVVLLLLGTFGWVRLHMPHETKCPDSTALPVLIVGASLLANSREFPNLLLTSVSLVVLAVAFGDNRSKILRWSAVLLTIIAGTFDVLTRASYWWWASDDTTTLAGIGTIIVERGRVDDVAGWSTSSHHWLLHAWLALWNLLSAGQIFETYLKAWPVVASFSLFSSLLLCLSLFLGRSIEIAKTAIVFVAAAGLIQLEWAAPQEQHPFVFALVACCALSLVPLGERAQQPILLQMARVAVVILVVPAILYVLKPTLLVAYGLLMLGTAFVWAGLHKGYGLIVALGISIAAIFGGIALFAAGSTQISQNSFSSVSVTYLSKDLGWCRSESPLHASLCVVSLQSVLVVAAALAVLVFWSLRKSQPLVISPIIFLPLVLAYVPLRLFISSAVFTGAPSFYRLSEMALMLFTSVGLGAALNAISESRKLTMLTALVVVGALVLIVRLNTSPGRLYDIVDVSIVKIELFRYLNAADVIALTSALGLAALIGILPYWRPIPARFLLALLCLVSLVPISRLATKSWTSETEPVRLSRPSYFGPADIEQVSDWIRRNTSFGTLLATNYLCMDDRIGECIRNTEETRCPRREPAQMASWALAALSRREFFYLSQFWDLETNYYFVHRLSTGLGSNLSESSVAELRRVGVEYYVASKPHTNSLVWQELTSYAEFRTENFLVVSLSNVERQL